MLEVVVAAFNERGYDATSLGVLAERLGLSKSAIYHHFASKEQMLEVALSKALDALEALTTGGDLRLEQERIPWDWALPRLHAVWS